jgi:uncharacterized protein
MSDNPPDKPRVRVQAHSEGRLGNLTTDSVANFVARLGIGAPNMLSQTSYTFNPITRLRQLLEWAYRGSWLVGIAVDAVADDMTRAGIEFNSDTPPDDLEVLMSAMDDIAFWQSLNATIKWSRLYGGALMFMQIDGQDPATPLDPATVPLGGLKGFLVFDRWMVQPTYSDLIKDFGPDFGQPVYYRVVSNAPFMPSMTIHHSRVVRMEGIQMPFQQRISENGWGISVVERLYDRLMAFDSGTMGAAQLLYKAYLRTYKVEGYRTIMGAGGALAENFAKMMEVIRGLQSTEGLTVIDSKDEFETHAYSFAGIPETLLMLGQQISGALGVPLVRLFGQAPAGLNATGDSDWRLYEAMINAAQEARLRRPLTLVFKVMFQSVLGAPPPETWSFKFRPIRQLAEEEKAEIAQRDADTVAMLVQGGIIPIWIALAELKQSSIMTGRFTNITDEMIEEAKQEPAPWDKEAQMEQNEELGIDPAAAAMGGAPGGPGGGAGGGGKNPFGGGGPKLNPGGASGGTGAKLPSAKANGKDHGPMWWRRERQAGMSAG